MEKAEIKALLARWEASGSLENALKARIEELYEAWNKAHPPPPPIPLGDGIAPIGKVWVCGACGKRSRDRFDIEASNGWDESCMLNAILIDESESEPPHVDCDCLSCRPWTT